MKKINWRKVWKDYENWFNDFTHEHEPWAHRKRKIRQLIQKQLKVKMTKQERAIFETDETDLEFEEELASYANIPDNPDYENGEM